MSPSLATFIAWTVLMAAMLVGFALATKKSRGVDDETEEVAAKALPTIGKVAEKKHQEKHGRALTHVPTESGAWYPPKRKKG